MFGTRGHRATFLLCLAISAVLHWVLLRGVRVDLSPRRDRRDRSTVEIPFLLPHAPRRGRPQGHPLRLLALREVTGTAAGQSPAIGAPRPAVKVPVAPGKAAPEEGERETTVSPPAGPSPFVLDSLDLLLSWPWLEPGPSPPASADRMTGLHLALRVVRERARAAKDSEAVALDTKYGRFGISPEGLMLGPIVIPLPLAPYRSAERREEEGAHAEIREQGKAESMRDDDTEGQRERIIEWWRRRKSRPEGP